MNAATPSPSHRKTAHRTGPRSPPGAGYLGLICFGAAFLLSLPAIAKTRTSVPQEKGAALTTQALLYEPVSLSFDDLLHLPWNKIEKRLRKMPFLQIEVLLWMITPIVDEVQAMSDVGVTLQKKAPLSESEKALLRHLAAKYKLEYASTLYSILNKDRLSHRDYRFIMLQFRQILRRQCHCARMYTQIGNFLGGLVLASNAFDSPIKAALWADSIARRVKAFKKLMLSIENYEKALGK